MNLDDTCDHEFLKLAPRIEGGEHGIAREVYVCCTPKRLEGKYKACGAELNAVPEKQKRDYFFERADDAVYASLHVHVGWLK